MHLDKSDMYLSNRSICIKCIRNTVPKLMLIQFGYFNKKEEMSKYAFVQNVHVITYNKYLSESVSPSIEKRLFSNMEHK